MKEPPSGINIGRPVSKIIDSKGPIHDTQGQMVAIRAPWERLFCLKVTFSSILAILSEIGTP